MGLLVVCGIKSNLWWGHRNRAKVQQPLFREHMHEEKWRELTREPLRSSPWSVAGSMPGGWGRSTGPPRPRSRRPHTAHRPEAVAGREGPRAVAAWAGPLLRVQARADEARRLDSGGVARERRRHGDEGMNKLTSLHCCTAYKPSRLHRSGGFRGWARRRWSTGLAVHGP